jgi:hypothetical protein
LGFQPIKEPEFDDVHSAAGSRVSVLPVSTVTGVVLNGLCFSKLFDVRVRGTDVIRTTYIGMTSAGLKAVL